MPKRNQSDVPFGSEFSPAVIDLKLLLEMVVAHQPDRAKLRQEIDRLFFPGKGKNADPRKTLAHNTVLSMIAYGILERGNKGSDVRLTEFGQQLYDRRNDPDALRELMGKQCLTNLRGLTVISCIQDMIAAGAKLTKVEIAKVLRSRGLHYPENGKHLNVLRQWLEFAGILNSARERSGDALWTPDEARLVALTGVGTADLDKWSMLTRAQYDFARTFARMGTQEARASDVRDYAIQLYGTEFPEGGLPQSVLKQLEQVGLITTKKTTAGRGAKSHVVYATEKLNTEMLLPLLEQSRDKLGPHYKRLVRMNLSEVLRDLQSSNTHAKGIALEALAFYFCRRLDLELVAWRLRGERTGGAEVDLLVEGARLVFTRWQIQCKNKSAVRVDDVAKEVGIAAAMRTHVVMLVTTGTLGPYVRKFATQVMENTAMQVILLDGRDLREIEKNVADLPALLSAQAREAMAIKRAQIEEITTDGEGNK